MYARNFITKYATKKGKAVVPYDKIQATNKWVEYMLDKHEINKILMNVDFATKMDLLEILDILERKIAYMYRHKNFEFSQATRLFRLLKDAPIVAK